jgi:hypothetical protein
MWRSIRNSTRPHGSPAWTPSGLPAPANWGGKPTVREKIQGLGNSEQEYQKIDDSSISDEMSLPLFYLEVKEKQPRRPMEWRHGLDGVYT